MIWCFANSCPHPHQSPGWTGEGSILCLCGRSGAQQLLRPVPHFAPSTTHLMLAHGHSAPFPSKQPASSFKRVIGSQPGGQGRISVLGPPRRWEGGQTVVLRSCSGGAGAARMLLAWSSGWGSLGSRYLPRTAGLWGALELMLGWLVSSALLPRISRCLAYVPPGNPRSFIIWDWLSSVSVC